MRTKCIILILVFGLCFSLLNGQLTQPVVEEIELNKTIIGQVFMCTKIKEVKTPESESEFNKKFPGEKWDIYNKVFEFCKGPLNKEVPTPDEIEKVYQKLISEGNKKIALETYKIKLGEEAKAGVKIFPEEEIVAGITEFLMKRARDEIVYGFLKDLEKVFEKNEHYQKLLPKTYAVLQAPGTLMLKTMLPTFKAAIKEDFKNFPQNILDFLKGFMEKIPPDDLIKKKKAEVFYQLVEIGTKVAEIYDDISKKKPILEAIGRFSEITPGNEKEGFSIKKALITVGLISKELNYLNIDNIAKLKNILKEYLDIDVDNENKLSDQIKFFVAIFDREAKIGIDKTDVQNILNFLDSKIKPVMKGLVDYIEKINLDQQYGKIDLLEHIQKINRIVGTSLNLIYPDRDKEITNKIDDIIDKILKIKTAVKEKQYNLVIVHVVDIIKTYMPDNKNIKKVALPFLALISNLAAAGDSESVVKAIEDFAAPVGSFQLKRKEDKAKFYFTVNSYFGLSGGTEKIRKESFKSGIHGSLFVPVGLELGISTTWKPISTISLFFSVIDVGTQVSYRLNEHKDNENNTVSSNPKVGFAQVFAPGGFVVLGITQRHPISIGAGFQYVPNLREIEESEKKVSTLRFSVFIAVDMTLFKF